MTLLRTLLSKYRHWCYLRRLRKADQQLARIEQRLNRNDAKLRQAHLQEQHFSKN